MCGRYSLTVDQEALAVALEVDRIFSDHHPRWNVAPTQEVPVVRDDGEGPRLDDLRWGLVPWWADDPSIGNRLINARSETVGSRRAFREAFGEGRRCLVPADGFYEWRQDPGGKTPHWVCRPDRCVFTMAGLWDRWRDPAGGQIRSFTVLTRPSTGRVRSIHDRMPVIVGPEDRRDWLGANVSRSRLEEILVRDPPPLEPWPVATRVNRPANEGPELLDGVPDLPGSGT